MARFKVGDRVTDGNAVYEITDVDDGIYEWKVVSDKADPSHSKGGVVTWADNEMRLANSAPLRSTNAVVQNAINARRARNAGDPNDPQWREAEAAYKDAQRKVEAAKKEVEAIRKRLEGKKNYIVMGDLGRMIKYLDYAMGNG